MSQAFIAEVKPYGLHPEELKRVVDHIDKGDVGIVPTDSVYAFCARFDKKPGFETICKLKHIDPRDAMMSLVCRDLSQASRFFAQWDTPTYRILHRNLPGPFTFILKASQSLPEHLRNRHKTLGLRIPEHQVIHQIVESLDMPLLVSSVHSNDEILEYYTDRHELLLAFDNLVSFIIEEEDFVQEASTVVDLTGEDVVVLREGRGVVVV